MIVHFINLYNYLEKDYIAKKVLASWQKFMPNAEFKLWTENDEFIKNILNKKSKFLDYAEIPENKIVTSLLCDYLKLNILYNYGGIISEFDQLMVKHIDIDENIEFCDMLNSVNTITSEFLPYYFKKGNKILEYLINEIDNNFDEEWFDFDKIDEVTGKDNPHLGKNELSLCYLRNLPSSLINDFIKLKENSKRFAEKNGYFTIHLSNWWIYRYDKIFISYNTDLFNLYKDSLKPKDNDTYFLVILNDKFAWRHNDKFFRTIGEWYKDYIIKNIKYEIFKHPEFKNKFIDAECILGDLDNITEKDWEIEI